MNTIHSTREAAEKLKEISMRADKRIELWQAIEGGMDAKHMSDCPEQGVHQARTKRDRTWWGQFGAATAGVALLVVGVTTAFGRVSITKTHDLASGKGHVQLPSESTCLSSYTIRSFPRIDNSVCRFLWRNCS